MIAIVGGRVLTPHEDLGERTILVEDGRIATIGPPDQLPPGAEVVDARGLTVAPGLIDLHTHGGDGVAANDGTPAALARLQAFYARHGVSGFLAGVWGSRAQIERGIEGAVQAIEAAEQPRGAALLGIFLEGPFLNPQRRGAFPPDTLVAPDAALLEYYIDRAGGHLRLLTLAPELPGADELIRLATARGVVCAAGHSAATWEQMQTSIEVGVRHATHTFNAMTALHHRDPGVLGAALADDRLSAEIIADGVHVHPAAVRILARSKPVGGAVLITDSIGAAGLADGTYGLGNETIIVEHGSARLADGTLAGSVLTMEQGVGNLVAFGAASLPDALAMGSTNPARVLGLGQRKGRIAEGMDADLFAFHDDLRVQWTMVGGRIDPRMAANNDPRRHAKEREG